MDLLEVSCKHATDSISDQKNVQLILKSVSLLPSENHLQLHSGVIGNVLSITYSLGWSCVQHGPQNCIIGRSSRAFELVSPSRPEGTLQDPFRFLGGRRRTNPLD